MATASLLRRLLLRALTGVAAAVAGLLVWVVAVPAFDVKLDFTDMQGNPQTVGPGAIIFFSIGPALAGWALIALLEWIAPRRAKLIWTVAAVAVLLISFVPLSQVSAAAAISLGLMHLAVGGVIIAALRATSPVPAAARAERATVAA